MKTKQSKPSDALLIGGMALALALTACYSHAQRHDYAVRTTDSDTVIVATAAPPAMRDEQPTAPPAENYVWISGYWGWSNGAYSWQPGHWDTQRVGYRWVPNTWVQDGSSWRMSGGHWEAVSQ